MHRNGSAPKENRVTVSPRRFDLSDSFRSPYAPGAIRSRSDHEHALIAGFLERHSEYAKLSAAELAVVAETYRDEDDRALRADLRDQGVDLDYSPAALERDAPHWSDEEGMVSGHFLIFAAGVLSLAIGLAVSEPNIFGTCAIVLGATLIGLSFETSQEDA